MRTADWNHPHIFILGVAAVVAVVGGYALGTRGARPVSASPVIVTNEVTAAPRARPDENTLIEQNAEREEAVRQPPPTPVEPAPRAEPIERLEPAEREEPPRRRRDRDRDRDLVDPGLEGDPREGKPTDE